MGLFVEAKKEESDGHQAQEDTELEGLACDAAVLVLLENELNEALLFFGLVKLVVGGDATFEDLVAELALRCILDIFDIKCISFFSVFHRKIFN